MPKSLWLLIIGMVINMTGASLLWPLNTIYIVDHLGKSLSVSGLILMLNAAAGVIGNLVGGFLFDRIGGYKSIISGIIVTLVAVTLLIFFHSFTYYVIFIIIIGFGSAVVFPGMYAMAGAVWPSGGRKPFNAIYVATNFGVALGAAIGGFVASFKFSLVFTVNALMLVLFLVIALLTYKSIETEIHKMKDIEVVKPTIQIKNKAKFMALMVLCIGYFLCWIGYVQWQSTISIYTQQLNVSLKQYSLLWTINGALIVLGQPIVSFIIHHFNRALKVQILIGIGIFILSFLIVGNAVSFTGFLVAMIVLTIGEMLAWPAIPTIANDLAPSGKAGFYQGIVNSTATGGRMIGPLLGGVIVDHFNIESLFYVIIFFYIIAAIATLFYDKTLKASDLLNVIDNNCQTKSTGNNYKVL